MRQAYEGLERRSEARWPTAFAFWFQRPNSRERCSAWMVDVSRGGAAFLVSPEIAPPVGETLRLFEMYLPDEVVAGATPELPRQARVLRVEGSPDAAIQRVAVRFEHAVNARLAPRERGSATVLKSRSIPGSMELRIVPTDRLPRADWQLGSYDVPARPRPC
ncbi:MAG: hypothetical protein CHACPFDD_02496 [Phycisphaerae bacterium]|nr:hypothetical protein [Phycisphaerae bacterium]